jgi:hypothetical protein
MILGISGLAGSGKDAVADILVKHRQCVKVALADPIKRICSDVFGFTNTQLWGPSESRNAPDFRYMVSKEYAEAYEKHKETDAALAAGYARSGWLTPRTALQLLGTEWGRRCYDPIWIEYALRVSNSLLSNNIYMRPVYSPQDGLHYTDRSAAGRRAGNGGLVDGVIIPDVRFRNEVKGLKDAGAKLIRVIRPGAGLKGAAAQHQSETEQLEIPDEDFDCCIFNISTLEALEACVRRVWEGLSTGIWPEPGKLEREAGEADGVTDYMLKRRTDS